MDRNILNFTGPLTDKDVEEFSDVLCKVQGNILQSHGRDHSIHIVFKFNDSEKDDRNMPAREWISNISVSVTSAKRQFDEAKSYRDDGISGRLFCSFFLSATGYERLGLKKPGNFGFRNGMMAPGKINELNDPPLECREKGYQDEIDAMLLLASNDKYNLSQVARDYIEELKEIATIHAVEHGSVIRNKHKQRVEHFGYVDGRSQPLFYQRSIEKETEDTDRERLQWNPGAPIKLALTQDPYAESSYGSYLVYRKLEQDVEGFRNQIKAFAATLTGPEAQREELAAALVMGRFRDGTPLGRHRPARRKSVAPNDFNYQDGTGELICPFVSHARLMNGREKKGYQDRDGGPFIIRRGITYGVQRGKSKSAQSAEVGLLFMAYQADLTQFEHLQVKWANKITSIDPIIGQPKKGRPFQHKWSTLWNGVDEPSQYFNFHGYVKLRGGEYFFTPSILFLETLPSLD